MSIKKTHEEFIQKVYDSNPYANNIEILEKYKSSKERIHCRCKIDATEWYPIAESLYHHGCPTCGHLLTKEKETKNNEAFLENLYSKRNDLLAMEKYKGYKTLTKFLCLVHNEIFYETPENILRFNRCCKKCGKENFRNKMILGITKAQEKINTMNAHIHINSNKYVNTKTNMNFFCDECLNFWDTTLEYLFDTHCNCPFCNPKSHGEGKIENFLKHNKIAYKKEKTFKGLVGLGNGLLKYDFYLNKHNLLIEFQGKQHEKPYERFGGQEQFEKQQEHDRRKRDYAKEHNIELLEIWYWDFNNIEQILNEKLDINSNKKSS